MIQADRCVVMCLLSSVRSCCSRVNLYCKERSGEVKKNIPAPPHALLLLTRSPYTYNLIVHGTHCSICSFVQPRAGGHVPTLGIGLQPHTNAVSLDHFQI